MSTKGRYVEILEFTHFSRVFSFNHTGEIGRKKEIFHETKVSVVIVNTLISQAEALIKELSKERATGGTI